MTRRVLRHAAFFIISVCLLTSSLSAWSSDTSPVDLWSFRGSTMGTTYMVKVSGAPGGEDWREETSFAIEAELRQVNDQMSTYLKTSELSRFNDSTSTDWFPVSRQTAEVVQLALEIGDSSAGRLDVTVGPLVDRWSFGPTKRSQTVPEPDEIESIRQRVGHQFLEARLEPPAIKKSIPELRIDLSAIAKGHGVDRVVALLNERGAENVFVEIGGEVRVSGAKQTPSGSVAWKVGIQKPDADANELALAHPMHDNAMATSGDYRNFFEVDGKRYSHTIDPTTGRPIDHMLASVTVIAPTCAQADGWATALNVAGPQAAWQLAKENGLDSLLIQRVTDPNQGNPKMISFEITGTGALAEVAERMNQAGVLSRAGTLAQSAASNEAGFGERMMPILILTAVGFGAVLIAMAIGVIFGRKSISGSCGGLNARTDPDGVSRCSMCSTPSEGCQELQEKIERGNA
ncbi:FAD:protein FMN transferase [Neorhodopirellula pilleata]|uniref:FAD:protein FMN transferase n=1 Tax=Neorhodopirellula pilleata TaxID=2714738 RepID=A0A5C6A987_9BACT|nr:FAD:protein FMN transferase [Neorhodopirellula pilleata]TWT96562.1 Thiamine biosynthesis lipoprotein ApbE precursor [Neorhodopirellula pilleata]